jgi:hypothetical protein
MMNITVTLCAEEGVEVYQLARAGGTCRRFERLCRTGAHLGEDGGETAPTHRLRAPTAAAIPMIHSGSTATNLARSLPLNPTSKCGCRIDVSIKMTP